MDFLLLTQCEVSKKNKFAVLTEQSWHEWPQIGRKIAEAIEWPGEENTGNQETTEANELAGEVFFDLVAVVSEVSGKPYKTKTCKRSLR